MVIIYSENFMPIFRIGFKSLSMFIAKIIIASVVNAMYNITSVELELLSKYKTQFYLKFLLH